MARVPENTLPSLRRALQDGAEGFEFDVRVTRDGVAVLLHDAALDRTTSGSGLLADRDARDVAGLDAGGGHAPPLLRDVLDEFLGRVVLGLEMKEVLPASVLESIGRAMRDRPDALLVVGSFDPAAVAAARAVLPEVPRALILAADAPVPSPAQADELGLWGIFAHQAAVDRDLVDLAHGRGLKIWSYTVNDPARARELVELGLEGLISDDPGRLRDAVPSAGSTPLGP